MATNRARTGLAILAVLSVSCSLAAASGAAAPDVAALSDRLDEVRPEFERAVDAAGLALDLDRARLSLVSGTLVPVARPGDGPPLEWVFVGAGRLSGRPPDTVEADQLAYFTGARAIDVSVRAAIVIPGGSSWAGEAPADRPATEIEAAERDEAARLFRAWADEVEREGFGARLALVRALAGDPIGRDFAGVWLETPELGRVYFAVDPSRFEPVGFGGYRVYTVGDFLTKRQRKNDRGWERTRRKRGQGPVLPDDEPACGERDDPDDEPVRPGDRFGRIEPWMSARRVGADPDAVPPGFESERYTIELELVGDDLRASGSVRLRLHADADGLRVVPMLLAEGMDVCSVEDASGTSLPFVERRDRVLVALAEPAVAGASFELTARIAGRPVASWLGRRGLRHTTHWYPRVGRIDRATYDVTLRWPEGLTLLASGTPVEAGVEDGRRWTRQALDVPSFGFSFEIDEYDVVEKEIGHLDLVVGFHRRDEDMTAERRAEIVTALGASLLYFESRLGVLPIDRMTVVVTDRGFSQGLRGFLTLAEGALHSRPVEIVDNRSGQEVRLSVIAHEVAHQWWGHAVGWASYRDQWLSEALATFSSTRFMTTIAQDPADHTRRTAERLRRSLGYETMGGRPIGSTGSVVLGSRLWECFGPTVYHAVVYDKGAAVFSTLAERLGREPTWQMLGALSRAVDNRVIRTETFFSALERMSGRDLDPFVEQFVYGTGVPVVFYEYSPRRQDDGTWVVEGVARQLPAERFRYAVVATEHGWDVARRFDREPDVSAWEIPLPFALDTSTPERPSGVTGSLTVRGARSEFSIPVDGEPNWLALDPDGVVLVETHGGSTDSAALAYRLGEHLLRLGRHDEAEPVLARAVAAAEEGEAPEDGIAVLARLALARLSLDRHDVRAARRQLNAAEEGVPKDSDFHLGERVVLDARLDLQTGRYDQAGRTLNEFLGRYAAELEVVSVDALLDPSRMSALRFARGEAVALLAVVEMERGYPDADVLIRSADLAGVDVRALH